MIARLRIGFAGSRIWCALLFSLCFAATADEPALPDGLEEPDPPRGLEAIEASPDEPALPRGLEPVVPSHPEPAESATVQRSAPAPLESGASEAGTDEPALPAGLELGTADTASTPEAAADDTEPPLPEGIATSAEQAESGESPEHAPEGGPLSVSGFWDTRVGARTRDDPVEDRMSLAESRLQLRVDRFDDSVDLRLVTDFVYDALAPEQSVDLLTGQGWFDLREANVLFRAHRRLDVKVGRQILTWGTGDLIFINDLFPKDWRSFFLGRDLEYLKAPSDAIRLTLAADRLGLDLVYSPRFNPDRYIDGTRISFVNPVTFRVVGEDDPIDASIPRGWFSDEEISARLHAMVGGFELAAYGYDGYWKSPSGYVPLGNYWWFPRLSVLGFSAQGPLGPGIASLEAGYYDSRDDRDGNDPTIRNSELRLLAGYEMEVAREVTVGLQYYLERMQDYSAYRRTLPPGTPAADENRQVLTLKLGWLLLNQDLRLNAFGYFSPSDDDGYLRASANYRIDDNWSLEAGLNQFFGRHPHTFFGQFEDNSNIYLGVRYGFAGSG